MANKQTSDATLKRADDQMSEDLSAIPKGTDGQLDKPPGLGRMRRSSTEPTSLAQLGRQPSRAGSLTGSLTGGFTRSSSTKEKRREPSPDLGVQFESLEDLERALEEMPERFRSSANSTHSTACEKDQIEMAGRVRQIVSSIYKDNDLYQSFRGEKRGAAHVTQEELEKRNLRDKVRALALEYTDQGLAKWTPELLTLRKYLLRLLGLSEDEGKDKSTMYLYNRAVINREANTAEFLPDLAYNKLR